MRKEITQIKKRFDEIGQQLLKPEVVSDATKMTALAREHRHLSEVILTDEKRAKIKAEIKNTQDLLKDPELKQEATLEIKRLEKELRETLRALRILLEPRDPNDDKNIIMEIRAGAGGEEAALFAADLFRMYSRFAEIKGWQVLLLNTYRTDTGGFKEMIFEVNGDRVYGQLKYESGVHRVQRIPTTEKSGRIHTSTASVAVLPQAADVEITIKPEELRIDVFRSSGPGGQSVNTTDSAVRITHLPTGIVASCQDQKSQLKNKEKALKILKTRLLDKKRGEEARTRAAQRRAQIGTADRSEKIRTYNFPQDRVTDHRIKKSWFGIDKILSGELDAMIKALNKNFK